MGLKKIIKGILRPPSDAIIGSSRSLPGYIESIISSSPAVVYNPHIAALYRPYKAYQDSYVILNNHPGQAPPPERRGEALPIPPYFTGDWTTEQWLESGKGDVGLIRKLAEESGFAFETTRRFLDFGCANGRIIRWLGDIADRGDVWGVDMLSEYIIWCQQHLGPPFKFATTTSFPHLPFEDNYFDIIHAASVFTHITELADAWLLELRRIVRPGGRLVISIHDEHTIALLIDPKADVTPGVRKGGEKILALEKESPFLESDYAMFSIHRAPGPGGHREAQVFYKTDYIRRHWGSMLDVLSMTPEAYGHQTVVVLGKPG
jgi:SAM-dependent methyltransferase